MFLNVYVCLAARLSAAAPGPSTLTAARGVFQLPPVNPQLQHVGSSSLIRGHTWAPCIGSWQSWPLDHHRSPERITLNTCGLYLNFFKLAKPIKKKKRENTTTRITLILVQPTNLTQISLISSVLPHTLCFYKGFSNYPKNVLLLLLLLSRFSRVRLCATP